MDLNTRNSYFERFCSIGKKRLVKKGECLYNIDLINEYVYCVEEGLCALVSITKSGEEKIYHYFSTGSIVNFTPAYLTIPSDTPSAVFYMNAKTDCWVYEIPYNKFYDFLSQNSDLNRYIMTLFAKHFTDVLEHFHFMQEASVPSRLCKTLIEFSNPCGKHLIVDKHFNYVELGKYLGVHTVTISRIMVTLKQQGAIEKSGHSIIITNPKILEDYIQEYKTLQY